MLRMTKRSIDTILHGAKEECEDAIHLVSGADESGTPYESN